MTDRCLHVLTRLILWVAATVVAVTAPGCAGERGYGPEMPVAPEGVEYQAGFFLTVSDEAGGAETVSRTPDGDYDPGEGWENHIDLDNRNIRVLVYTADNRFVRELGDFDIMPYSSVPGSKTYHLVCRVKEEEKWDAGFKMMILANWPSYPDFAQGLGGVWQSAYTYDPSPLSATNLIPLYGIKECDRELEEDRYVDLGTIHLLRAMAKVEVVFPAENNPFDFWEIETMEITRHNTRGLCAPEGVTDEEDYVKGYYDGDYVSTPSIPAGAETVDPLPMTVLEKNRRWMVYLPEYRNVGRADGEKARIHVKFKDSGVEYEQFIDFRYYKEDGKEFDILRNNWYRYVLSKNAEEQDLTIEVDVRFYASVELRPGFGR